MNKSFIRFVLLCFFSFLLIGYIFFFVIFDSNEGDLKFPTTDEVAFLSSKMTIREKIGQMIIMDFRNWKIEGSEDAKPLLYMNEEVAEIINKYGIGGVILFQENINSADQIIKFNNEIQKNALNGIPLFIGVNQEGGAATNFRFGISMPGNMALGATDNVDYAFESSSATGEILRKQGFNINFSPILNVDDNIRCFGDTAEQVSKLGLAAMHGYQLQGIIPGIKYFPGGSEIESIGETPKVEKNINEMMKKELKPFINAIDNGAEIIVMSNTQYPLIDGSSVVDKETGEKIYTPASFSYKIITNLLRNNLGYDGVIMTGALNSPSVKNIYSESEAAIEAINAGADMLLMPIEIKGAEDLYKMEVFISELESAVMAGKIRVSDINNAVNRILTLKEKHGLLDNFKYTDINEEKTDIISLEKRELEMQIAEEAITCLANNGKDGNTILPYKNTYNKEILFFAPTQEIKNSIELGRKIYSDKNKFYLQNYQINTYENKEKLDENQKKSIDKSDIVILYTDTENKNIENWRIKYPRDIIEYCKSIEKNIIVVCTNSPEEVLLFNDADAILLCYSNKGTEYAAISKAIETNIAFGPNIPASVGAIFGAFTVNGKLPVTISQTIEGEEKIYYKYGSGIKIE